MEEIILEDYDYYLPEEKIAKYPLSKRDEAKLLIYNNKKIFSDKFFNLHNYLKEDSLILLNDTKVINARVVFEKETGSKIEIFCLEPITPQDYYLIFAEKYKCSWKCLIGNNKKWKSGILSKKINVNNKKLVLNVSKIKRYENGFEILFEWDNSEICFSNILESCGEIPIPPYLHRDSEEIDKSEYQTIFSHYEGSVAAPTAGLHFTNEVIKNLKNKNISIDNITLHVGAGTFQPIKTKSVLEHSMHNENFRIKKSCLENIIKYYGKICAVGTTTVRSIESLYQIAIQIFKNKDKKDNNFIVEQFEAYKNESDNSFSELEILENLLAWMEKNNFNEINCNTKIMIIPGYKFKIVKELITNFHQPKSTLLLLLSAFMGNEWKIMYDYALKNEFRFLSYGDAGLLFY